jgi:hypothetical protein
MGVQRLSLGDKHLAVQDDVADTSLSHLRHLYLPMFVSDIFLRMRHILY